MGGAIAMSFGNKIFAARTPVPVAVTTTDDSESIEAGTSSLG